MEEKKDKNEKGQYREIRKKFGKMLDKQDI